MLLVLALVFEVGAVVLTPTEMQKWARRSKFGELAKKGKGLKDWEEEKKALDHLLDPPAEGVKAKPKSPPLMIFPIMNPGSDPESELMA